ncbi:hypothetical protein G6O69_26080 [Pseudenhygromyxa sp. WMMC2535]|uniref:hypothetical protein n=1 Tax=Pseudenhygromyxa sp. WMMC2535 TaxID=2712867 RepID=UPI001595A76F|nr:hypothetical protein [Pseudenhygromyxa sp. WMMC2535]NVB41333.1 hypothetical protein [Pseudenhygromyxa sp. WMMC2535]
MASRPRRKPRREEPRWVPPRAPGPRTRDPSCSPRPSRRRAWAPPAASIGIPPDAEPRSSAEGALLVSSVALDLSRLFGEGELEPGARDEQRAVFVARVFVTD